MVKMYIFFFFICIQTVQDRSPASGKLVDEPRTTRHELVSLFGDRAVLDRLTIEAKLTAVRLLVSTYCRRPEQLPSAAVASLVAACASAPDLLRRLADSERACALTVVAADGCAGLRGAPVDAAAALIAAFSRHRSWLKDAPPPTARSFLAFVAAGCPADDASDCVLSRLPPPALLGLSAELSDATTCRDAPTPATVGALLRPGSLTAFPVRDLDSLLAVLGSCPPLLAALPAAKIAVLLDAATAAFESVDRVHLVDVLDAASSVRTLAYCVPLTAWRVLLRSCR